MARVKGGTVTHASRKRVLKRASGYFGSKHLLFKTAKEQVMHSLRYAYISRRTVKRDYRKLWIRRINAACRMNDISYSKYRFEQQKKAKEAKKKQHTVEIKEVQLTPQIGGHDMDTKARAAQKFLEAGNKVKVGVRFRGRQMTHIEVGQEVMDKFIAQLSDYANIEKPSAMEGRWMYAILAPKKK